MGVSKECLEKKLAEFRSVAAQAERVMIANKGAADAIEMLLKDMQEDTSLANA